MTSKSLLKGLRALVFCMPFVLGFAVSGCDDDEDEVIEDNCSDVCNNWADCGHPDTDVDACIDNCTSAVEDADVDDCSDCLVDLTCTTVSTECDDECAFILD